MTNNFLFAALYRGYYEEANDNSKVALLEYFIPVISRWNIQWGDGTLDPFSNQIIKFVHSNEKHFLKYFGNGSKLCLLYTSPSPRDPKTSRMPSSA